MASDAVGQIVQCSVLGTLPRKAVADAAVNVAGTVKDDAPQTRVVCVAVPFKNGVGDQETKLPGKDCEALRLRYRQTVVVAVRAWEDNELPVVMSGRIRMNQVY